MSGARLPAVGTISIWSVDDPSARFAAYTNVGIDGFSEKGSLAPLVIHSDSAELFPRAVGLRVFYPWQIGPIAGQLERGISDPNAETGAWGAVKKGKNLLDRGV